MTQKVLVNRSRSDRDSLYSLVKGSSFNIAAILDLSEHITVVCITSLLRETDTGTEGHSCNWGEEAIEVPGYLGLRAGP